MRAAGFVLVGGRSSRMGADKALLPWGSSTLVEHVAARVKEAAGSVAVIGAPDRYRQLPLERLRDLRPGLGPLAGIEAALASGRGDLNLIVACDMPDLHVGFLNHLLRAASQSKALCMATRDASPSLQPLCAVYRSACLPTVQQALDESRLKLFDLLRSLCAEPFDAGFCLKNINRPGDWHDLQH